MDCTMEDKMLKLHPDTVMTLRKMFNLEKPGEIDTLVDALRDWLKKQHHLTKREYSRQYLERSIIFMKGSVERAKSQIDKLCSLRTLLPKFFQVSDTKKDYDDLIGLYANAFLPQLTEDHCRVFALRAYGNGFTKRKFNDCINFFILFCEYFRTHDYSNGIVGILDYRDVNIVDFLASIDLVNVNSLITILMHGYGLRVKGVHVITSSKAIKSTFDIVKKMFEPKIAARFHTHDKIDTLYEYVPKAILPSEFGGEEKPLVTLDAEWRDVLGTNENIEYLREMSQAVSNEAYRMKEKLSAVDLGIAGTFRSLNVD